MANATTLYDITDHSLLTEKATAYGAEKLSWQQFEAERLLGLETPAYTEEPYLSTAILAVVLQVNFQVAQGLDPLIEEEASSSHLKQSKVWRDRYLNPQSVALVASIPGQSGIRADRWATMTSYRTSDEQC